MAGYRRIFRQHRAAKRGRFSADEAWEKKTVSLNGVWKFHYCESVNDIIEGYYAPDFDLSSFDDLEVPSEWQIKGYDTPIYTNINYPKAISTTKIPYIKPELNSCGLYVREFGSTRPRIIYSFISAASIRAVKCLLTENLSAILRIHLTSASTI